jgi:hypothetical protein
MQFVSKYCRNGAKILKIVYAVEYLGQVGC